MEVSIVRAVLMGLVSLMPLVLIPLSSVDPGQWEAESNNTRSLADSVAALPGSGARRGALTEGDVDYYWFSVASSGMAFIKTSSDGDTVITLEDDQGRVLAEDDDSGVGSNARISQFLFPGKYYAAVEGFGGQRIEGEYVLHVSSAGQSHEVEANDDRWGANPIGTLLRTPSGILAVSGSLEQGDVDCFQVEVVEDASLHVLAIAVEDMVVSLEGGDERGPVGSHVTLANGWRMIQTDLAAAGTYYVKVEGAGDGEIGSYTLVVGTTALRTDSPGLVSLEDGAYLIWGALGEEDESCAYRFVLEEARVVSLMTFTDGDTVLTLKAGDEVLKTNDDASQIDLRSEIVLRLEAGSEYSVDVSGYNDQTGKSFVLYMTTE
jgi:hypothetical protein